MMIMLLRDLEEPLSNTINTTKVYKDDFKTQNYSQKHCFQKLYTTIAWLN